MKNTQKVSQRTLNSLRTYDEYTVRIIFEDDAKTANEYRFERYDYAIQYANNLYEKSGDFPNNPKRIELLKSNSYRIPLLVFEF